MIRRFVRIAGAELVEVPWWRGDYPVEAVLEQADDDHRAGLCRQPQQPHRVGRLARCLPTSARGAAPDTHPPRPGLRRLHRSRERPRADCPRVPERGGRPHPLQGLGRRRSPRRLCARRSAGGRLAATDRPALSGVNAVAGPGGRHARRSATARGRSGSRPSAANGTNSRSLLTELGAEVLPSQGSFVFARFADARRVWSSLHALGIAVRAFHGRPDVEGWLRITLPGDETAFTRLTHALRTVLAPEALLFDMDGVLADVSGSYREAILANRRRLRRRARDPGRRGGDRRGQRQQRLGADPPPDGGARGRAPARRGQEPASRRSTREPRPNRVSAAPSACSSSPTSCGPSAGRLPAGGGHRPAARRRRALSRRTRHRRLFPTVVTMEDAPLKPDPAPVRLALERLGVATAWMLGDTPDDHACRPRRGRAADRRRRAR